jgi:hypothetical protein
VFIFDRVKRKQDHDIRAGNTREGPHRPCALLAALLMTLSPAGRRRLNSYPSLASISGRARNTIRSSSSLQRDRGSAFAVPRGLPSVRGDLYGQFWIRSIYLQDGTRVTIIPCATGAAPSISRRQLRHQTSGTTTIALAVLRRA